MTRLRIVLVLACLACPAASGGAAAQGTTDPMFLAGGSGGWKCNANLLITTRGAGVIKTVQEHGSPAQYMASSWCVALCKNTPNCIAVNYTHTFDAQGDAHTCTLFGAVAGTSQYPTIANKQWGAACIKTSAFTWRPAQPKTFDDVQPFVPGDATRGDQDRLRPATPDQHGPGSRRP